MVSLVDTVESVGSLADLQKSLTEAVTQNAVAGKASGPNPTVVQQEVVGLSDFRVPADDKIPAKLRGKTAAEVIEMYQNLESAYGRQANDLGTQRKLTDRLLDLKRESDLSSNSNAPRKLPEVRTNELLENPAEVIDRIVAERIQAVQQETQQRTQEIETRLAAERFVAKHPDYNDIAQDPEFAAWLEKSQYRIRAAQQARNGDYAAADDLLSEYKERKHTSQPKKQEESSELESARQASLESGASPENAGRKAGKTYRRADLIRLRLENPDEYYRDDFQAEIMRAYREKRVV